MDIFKEHIIGLQMAGEDVAFAELPTASKTALTKQYNNLNNDSIKIKRGKKSSPTDANLFSGQRFDPTFMEIPEEASSEDDEDQ